MKDAAFLKSKLQGPRLSFCQEAALRKLDSDANFFVTGYAGTGKSYLVSHYLKNQTRYESMPILASTGAAAVLIGGRTFHSFFGLGIMRGTFDDVVKSAVSNRNVRYRIRKAQCVVIDEVSMLSGEAMSAAEEIARVIREENEPWGGIRVIAVGDFAQLPPIGNGRFRPWAFMHPVWQLSRFEPIILKTMVRMEDEAYLKVLNEVREGKVSDNLKRFLESRMNVPDEFDGTRLFPLRNATEKYNLEKLETLSGKTFRVLTKYTGNADSVEYLKTTAPIPEVLCLKKNALVMIRVNDPMLRYVNGTVGKVADWDEDRVYVNVGRKTVELERSTFTHMDGDGEIKSSATNFPLSLAWAATIHKAQGSTLEKVLLDLETLWEPGHAYVALSRTRSSEDVYVSKWSEKSIRCDPQVSEFYRTGCPYDFCEETYE
jgi:ATP-dependent DNA helicase PIF1